jgi:two-component sensor histidine kinase
MPLRAVLGTFMTHTRPLPLAARIIGTVGLVAIFSLARLAVDPIWPAGYPFLLAFLAVILAAALFNENSGIIATILTALFGMYFYLPPTGSLKVSGYHNMMALSVYVLTGFAASLVIETLHKSLERLAQAQKANAAQLREFRHRTRNDLQSLVGIILIRSRESSEPAIRSALKDAASHAISLARIHNHLMKATPGDGQEAMINVRDFISGLCSDAQTASGSGGGALEITCASESHMINTERVVQIGLLVNELIKNANGAGQFASRICVHFFRLGNSYVLTVSDNAPDTAGSLSTRLLQYLAAQLTGKIHRVPRENGMGMKAEIRFPVQRENILTAQK